jgi:hypothetical protein
VTKKTKTRILIAAAVCCLLYFTVWPFVVGGPRMRWFCESLSPGTKVTDVQARAAARGYTFIPPNDEHRLPGVVIDGRAFGRFTCQFRLEGERLVSAQYQFND